MTDKQITSNDYIFELNEMCIDCIGEVDECECRKIAENLHFKLYCKEQECERLKAKIEYVFSDTSPNFDYFCDICVAKDSCNQNCCFEQIKELIYEVE